MTLVVVSPGEGSDEAGTIFVSAKRKAKEFEYRFVHLLAHPGTTFDAVRNAPRSISRSGATSYTASPRCQNRVAARKWRDSQKTDHKTARRKEDGHGKKRGQG
jgi:hypothetical protein